MFLGFYLNTLAQISPGELSKVHSKFEGISNCTKCHELGKKVTKAKCLSCHTEISDLLNANRGFHSQKKVVEQKCWDCHGEHYGRKFQVVRFDENKFDHNDAGFELKAKHKEVKCDKCHKKENIVIEELKKRDKTFLGLSTSCNDCHEDVHNKTLGSNCSDCHTEEKFKPAVKFDHNKAKFKLDGKHLDVACEKCHPKEKRDGKDFQKFKRIKFANCGSCHKDPHKNRFGNDCKSCHNTTSFNNVDVNNGFNHSRTRFPLIGKHKLVKCNDCHKGGIKNKPKFANCYDCHEDYHKGEFVKNNQLRNCNECHNEKGFSPSLFTIEKHSETKFNLTFAHQALPCFECHRKEDIWKFKIDGSNCISCHTNIHEDKISEDFFNVNKCEKCHTTKNWESIEFDHNKTQFELLGKHKSTSCGDCHIKKKDGVIIEQRFSILNNNCSQCHNDIHYGQFIDKGLERCIECHTFNNWKPDLFNHAKTKFALDGAHRKLECSECHKVIEKSGNKFINYKLGDSSCKSCHSS